MPWDARRSPGRALASHATIDCSRRERAVEPGPAQRVSDGTPVIILPEGARGSSGGLLEFKSGGFQRTPGRRVRPIRVSGSPHTTPKRSLQIESGCIPSRCGAPIPTRGMTIGDRQKLKDPVRAAIEAGLDPGLQAEPTSSDP